MRYLLPVVIASLLLLSCNTGDRKNNEPSSLSEASPVTECFQYAAAKDTITLRLIFGPTITGTLDYDWNEKDDNSGTITGVMKDDLLVADYSFTSEGTTSVRQVVFKKIDQGYVEGYGELETKDNKTVFKDLTSLRLNDSIILAPVDCGGGR